MPEAATLDDNGSELARQSLDQPSHFIRALTDLAEEREVVATKDIYTKNGIKLVSRGARLSGRFYERLIAHKLLKPIEESIAVAETPASIPMSRRMSAPAVSARFYCEDVRLLAQTLAIEAICRRGSCVETATSPGRRLGGNPPSPVSNAGAMRDVRAFTARFRGYAKS